MTPRKPDTVEVYNITRQSEESIVGVSVSGNSDKIVPPWGEREMDSFPKERLKTVWALVFVFFTLVLNAVSLALVHDRGLDPATYPPLPDIFLDGLPTQPWALLVADHAVSAMGGALFVVLFFHKHRWIVFRRSALIIGFAYIWRPLCMYVTAMPVASFTLQCHSKSNVTSMSEIATRVGQLVIWGGLSTNVKYCGDYIYSGHTVNLIGMHLLIREYTRPSGAVRILHWATCLLVFIGEVAMLLSRDHYSVDIIIAYYVTTRTFWIYHTLVHNRIVQDGKEVGSAQNDTGRNSYLPNPWWFPIFRYMEQNVRGKFPNEFALPWKS